MHSRQFTLVICAYAKWWRLQHMHSVAHARPGQTSRFRVQHGQEPHDNNGLGEGGTATDANTARASRTRRTSRRQLRYRVRQGQLEPLRLTARSLQFSTGRWACTARL